MGKNLNRAAMYWSACKEVENGNATIPPSPPFPKIGEPPDFGAGYSSLLEFLGSKECDYGRKLLEITGRRIILSESRPTTGTGLGLMTVIFFGGDGFASARLDSSGEWDIRVLSRDDILPLHVVERIYSWRGLSPEKIVPFILRNLDELARSVWF